MSGDSILRTPTCERLGIKYPIFQAGRGFVAHAELTAAVSNAGGPGCVGSGSMGARELKEQIQRRRDLIDRRVVSKFISTKRISTPHGI
jgi:enoyl-[acyl-carrier protein] reductase II